MENKFKIGDRFTKKNSRDAPVFEITEVVIEPYDDITYTMVSLIFRQEVKISESNLIENYRQLLSPTAEAKDLVAWLPGNGLT